MPTKITKYLWLVEAIQTHDSECCLLWPFLVRSGYGYLTIKGKQQRAHRVTFYLTHKRWPNIARHSCDVRHCVNPNHIIDGDIAANVADRVARNRGAKGTSIPWAKLDDSKVQFIRETSKDVSMLSLANRFGVAPSTIRQIVHREIWKHVK